MRNQILNVSRKSLVVYAISGALLLIGGLIVRQHYLSVKREKIQKKIAEVPDNILPEAAKRLSQKQSLVISTFNRNAFKAPNASYEGLLIERKMIEAREIVTRLKAHDLDEKSKTTSIQALDAVKYELETLAANYDRATKASAKRQSNDKLKSILTSIDNVYGLEKAGSLSPDSPDLKQLESSLEVDSPTEVGKTFSISKFNLKEKPPLAAMNLNSNKKLEAVINAVNPLPKAYATEVLSCSEKFFADPVNPEDPSSQLLNLDAVDLAATSELRAAATNLKSPFKIFQFVRDEIKYEPYIGSVQNAESVFLRRSANQWDKATLLVSMFRSASIPARYIVGDVLMSEKQLQAIWRLETPLAVWSLHANMMQGFRDVQGRERQFTISGENYYIVPHVWVEAYIPYDDKRGVGIQTTRKQWIPLDPSFQNHEIKVQGNTASQIQYEADSVGLKLFDREAYLLNPDPETGKVVKQLNADEVLAQNVLGILNYGLSGSYSWAKSFLEYVDHGKVISPKDEILPIGPAGVEACVTNKISQLPADQKLQMRVQIQGIDYLLNAPEIGLKNLYVVYAGNTATDDTKLSQVANGTLNPVGQNIKVKPQLYLEDQLLGTGSIGDFGASAELKVIIDYPDIASKDTVEFSMFGTNGNIFAPTSSLRSASTKHIDKRIANLLSNIGNRSISSLTYGEKSKIIGKTLSTALMVLNEKNEAFMTNVEGLTNTIGIGPGDAMIMKSGIRPIVLADRMFGYVPEKPTLTWAVNHLWIARSSQLVDGMPSQADTFLPNKVHSIGGSALEHQIFEDFFSIQSQSTVKAIQTASDQGIEVINEQNVTSANVNTILARTSGYPANVLDAVRSRVQEIGTSVLIMPKTAPSFEGGKVYVAHVSTKYGTGFMNVIDGNFGGTGGTGFLETLTGFLVDAVSGLVNAIASAFTSIIGGVFDALSYLTFPSFTTTFATDLANGPVANASSYAGCPVNLNNGGMWHIFNDFPAMAGPGVPLRFERTYQAQYNLSGPLGFGWSHNMDIRVKTVNGSALNLTQNQQLYFFDEDNVAVKIVFDNNKPVLEPWHKLIVTKTSTALSIKKHDFSVYTFNPSGVAAGKVQKITDRNGNQTSFQYSATNGALQKVTDSVGRFLSFAYDGSSRINKVADHTGRFVEFTYDSNGDLITSKDLRGFTTSYAYLSGQVNAVLNHNLQSFTDPEGNSVQYFYYPNDKVFKHIEPENKTTVFVYNTFNKETTVIDTKGERIVYQYDVLGNVVRKTNPDKTFEVTKWDPYKNKTEIIDEDGFSTKFTTDDRANVVKITPPAPYQPTEITYHGTFNLPTSIKDGNGNFTDYSVDGANGDVLAVSVYKGENKSSPMTKQLTYFADGRIKTATDAKSQVTTFERSRNAQLEETVVEFNRLSDRRTSKFDSLGRAIEETDENGRLTRVEYNQMGQPTMREVVGTGIQERLDYDKIGNVIRSTRVGGGSEAVTAFSYDGLGNRTSVIDAEGRTTTTSFAVPGCGCGANAQATSVTDPSGNKTEYQYNWRGNITKIIDAKGGITNLGYDSRGNLVSLKVQDRTGQVLSTQGMKYDGLKKLSAVTDYVPLSNENLSSQFYKLNTFSSNAKTLTSFLYDGAGNLRQKLAERLGQQVLVEFIYTPFNKIARKHHDVQNYEDEVLYSYDDNQNVTAINNRFSKLEFTYDPLDRLKDARTVTDPAAGIRQPSSVLTYEYDKVGQVKKVSSDGVRQIDFGFDSAFRLNSVAAGGGSISLGRDQFGRINSLGYPNGISTQIRYDNTDRVESINASVAGSRSYEFDPNGNVRSVRSDRGEWNVSYDSTKQIIQNLYKGANGLQDESFAWDAAGNPAGNKILNRPNVTGFKTRPLTYNNYLLEDGEVTNDPQQFGLGHFAYRYDLSGNVIQRFDNLRDELTQYRYDGDNRLRAVETSHAVNGFIRSTNFRYDGLGRRVEREDLRANGFVDRRYYIYDRSNILFEYDKTAANRTLFVGTGDIDSHLMFIKDGKSYFYHVDHLGSVVGISDDKGSILQKISYKSFGSIAEMLNGQGQALSFEGVLKPLDQPYYFTGREFDSGTGMYYYRARYYDPGTGRFTSPDPKRHEAGDANFYRYTLNNPVNATDPSGLDSYLASRDLYFNGSPASHNFIVVTNDQGTRVFSYGPQFSGASLPTLQAVPNSGINQTDTAAFMGGSAALTRIYASDDDVLKAASDVNQFLASNPQSYNLLTYNSNTAAQAVATRADRYGSVQTPSSSILGAPGSGNASRINGIGGQCQAR